MKLTEKELFIIKDLLNDEIKKLQKHLEFDEKYKILPEKYQKEVNDLLKKRLSECIKIKEKL